jgi:hypothetical protein
VRGTIGIRESNLGAGDEVAASATLPITAAVALDDAHVTVDGNDESAGECPGTARNPTAAGGFVCIYPWFQANVEAASPDGVIWGDDAAAAEKWGFQSRSRLPPRDPRPCSPTGPTRLRKSHRKPGASQRDAGLPD